MRKWLFATALLLLSTSVYAGRPMHGVGGGGGGTPPPDGQPDVSCGGPTTNNWCIQANGWTKFTISPSTTGTCNNTGGTRNGTCIVAVSTAGNDGTCAAEIPPVGLTTETLSSFVPATPCATGTVAQSKLRNNQPDWMVFRKGDTFAPIGNGTGLLTNKNGKSGAEPMLLTAYGTGARPRLVRTNPTHEPGIIKFQGAGGNNVAVVGFYMYDAVSDPSNATYYGGADFVGDTGTANGCATNNEICNIVGGTPAKIISAPTNFRIFGTGLINTAIQTATASTVTFAATVAAGARGTAIKYQVLNAAANAAQSGGVSSGITHDFMFVEDNRMDWTGGIATSQVILGTPGTGGVPNVYFRRNFISNAWGQFGNGACIYTGPAYTLGVQFLLEENVCNYGGFWPYRWSGGKHSGTHGYYLHDPSTGYNLNGNIVANGSSTGVQYRSAATSYNNLMINVPIGISFNIVDHDLNASYDVVTNGVPGNSGYRTAICATTCVTGTTISFEGILTHPPCEPCSVINLSNPGSVTGTITTTSAYTSPTSVTIVGTGLSAGKRGDGVKTGDKLQLVNVAPAGTLVARNMMLFSAGPSHGVNGEYLGPSKVAIDTAADTVTETGGATDLRVIDEPFQFPSGAVVSATSQFVGGVNQLSVYSWTSGAIGVGMVFTSGPAAIIGRTITSQLSSSLYNVSGASLGSISEQTMTLSQTGSVTLPPELAFDTTYCTATQTNAYQIYLATGGACNGGTAINMTGSNVASVLRTGTRKFLFNNPVLIQPPANTPWPGIPAYVTPGMETRINGGSGACGSNVGGAWPGQITTVQSIASDRYSMIMADATLFVVSGKDNGTSAFSWGGVGASFAPVARLGPNNVYTHIWNPLSSPQTLYSISAQPCMWGLNADNNYTYNWSTASQADNKYDISAGQGGISNISGGAAYTASNSFNWNLNVVNDYATPARPETLVEAYDANLRGTTFTGTIAPNGSGGSIVTITGGVPPLAGDVLFDASGSNTLPYYTVIPPGQTIGSTFFIDQAVTKSTPFAMKSGSVDHFMELALSQSKETGWIAAYSANAANNFIRNAVGCTAASTPPCPAQ